MYAFEYLGCHAIPVTGTLGDRWRAKLHIIKHYQNWTLGTYKTFYSVTIFVIVSSLSDDKHLLFLFFWRSAPFVLARGVFLSTKIARNTPNSMKENLLLFLLHHATKRSGGDVWLMWGRGAMFRGQWVGLAKESGTINHCWQTQLPLKTLNYRGTDIWALGTKLGRSHLQDR